MNLELEDITRKCGRQGSFYILVLVSGTIQKLTVAQEEMAQRYFYF